MSVSLLSREWSITHRISCQWWPCGGPFPFVSWIWKHFYRMAYRAQQTTIEEQLKTENQQWFSGGSKSFDQPLRTITTELPRKKSLFSYYPYTHTVHSYSVLRLCQLFIIIIIFRSERRVSHHTASQRQANQTRPIWGKTTSLKIRIQDFISHMQS